MKLYRHVHILIYLWNFKSSSCSNNLPLKRLNSTYSSQSHNISFNFFSHSLSSNQLSQYQHILMPKHLSQSFSLHFTTPPSSTTINLQHLISTSAINPIPSKLQPARHLHNQFHLQLPLHQWTLYCQFKSINNLIYITNSPSYLHPLFYTITTSLRSSSSN